MSKQITSLALFANGYYGEATFYRQEIKRNDYIIAVDGGANFLFELEVIPDEILGDFDSIKPEVYKDYEKKPVKIQRHPREKDESDLELALIRAVELKPAGINIYGALGKRVDHLISNIMVLIMPRKKGIPAVLKDENHEITIIDSHYKFEGKQGDYLSLFPLTHEAKGIVTSGLKYQLQGESLLLGPSRGLSNEFTGRSAEITLDQGYLVAIKTKRN